MKLTKGQLIEWHEHLAMGEKRWSIGEFDHYGNNGRHLYVRMTSGRLVLCRPKDVREVSGS